MFAQDLSQVGDASVHYFNKRFSSIDKEPPQVVFCPNDTRIIDASNRLVVVNYTEPIFTDNVAVVNITQTHRSGRAELFRFVLLYFNIIDTGVALDHSSFHAAIVSHHHMQVAPRGYC